MATERGTTMQGASYELHRNLIEDHEGISCLRNGAGREGWNGIQYETGINRDTVGAQQLSMNLAMVPPGAIAKAHIHVGFEVGLYILQGRVQHRFGEGLTEVLENGPGDFIFIKPGVPHEVYNLSDSEPIVAVVTRSTPNQWDEIVPYQV